MLAAASRRLKRFGQRVELRLFDLAGPAWLQEAGGPFRCVLSSLAFHHLTPEEKRRLFKELREKLEPGGVLLLADVTEPASRSVWQSVSATWHRVAREQSLAASGALDLYERCVEEGWAPPEVQPPGEMPSGLFEQLKWLEEAGFSVVDCFWMRAGIAIYGGYR
jgi:cyclopropane fatty-acyl-phospholipid synthase-like methyltransferase